MNKIKQEKGVTLLFLSIAVLVLMILAGLAIGIGNYDVSSTVDSKLQGELKMVQHAVLEQYVKYKTTLNESYIVGEIYDEKIDNFMSQNYATESLTIPNASDRKELIKKYYYLTPDNLERIGIEDSQNSYIVNYYTGEVINADKYKTSNGIILYIKGITNSDQEKSSY